MIEDLFIVQPGVFWAKGAEAVNLFSSVAEKSFATGYENGIKDAAIGTLVLVGVTAVTYGSVKAYKKYQTREQV